MVSIGNGFFDLTRVRRFGLKNLILGMPDGSPDPDCPCPQQGSCPCNKCTLTNYCKISGLLQDVQWAVYEITVFYGLENIDITSVVQTILTITVNDNCNTGFSDDSGVQKPCLTATATMTVEVIPRPQKEVFYYASPEMGVDQTLGYLEAGTTTLVVLDKNASSVDDTYKGLQLTILAGSAAIAATSAGGGTRQQPDLRHAGDLHGSGKSGRRACLPAADMRQLNFGLDLRLKTLSLKSTQGPNSTIIDCAGQGPVGVFAPSSQILVVIQGFTIQGCSSQVCSSHSVPMTCWQDGGALVFRRILSDRVGSVNAQGAAAAGCSLALSPASGSAAQCKYLVAGSCLAAHSLSG
eukprot:753796-Hanusia_phi.AAC.2